MKRIFLLLLVGVLFAACAPASSSETAVSIPDEPERPATAVVEEEPVAEVEPTNEPSEPVESDVEESVAASDIENFPAANVAEASIVRERDWKLGSDDPLVTIIEYGDYQ